MALYCVQHVCPIAANIKENSSLGKTLIDLTSHDIYACKDEIIINSKFNIGIIYLISILFFVNQRKWSGLNLSIIVKLTR